MGQQPGGLELGEDAPDGRAGHAEAVALDERLAADRRRGGDVFLDDGPKDRLRAKVQGADGAASSSRQGRSPAWLALYGESANGVAGIVAVAPGSVNDGALGTAARTRGRPRAVRRAGRTARSRAGGRGSSGRPGRPVVTSSSSAASAQPKRVRERRLVGRRRAGRRVSVRRPRMTRLARPRSSGVERPRDAARRQAVGGRPSRRARAPRGSRRDGRRSSAGSTPSNACAPGPTASYGRRSQ